MSMRSSVNKHWWEKEKVSPDNTPRPSLRKSVKSQDGSFRAGSGLSEGNVRKSVTSEHRRVLFVMQGLAKAHNWQGLSAMDDEAMQTAKNVRDTVPGMAGDIYFQLGEAYRGLGQMERAITMYEQEKAIMQEVGDRDGLASASNNVGNCYMWLGQYDNAIEMHEQDRAIREALGDLVGQVCLS